MNAPTRINTLSNRLFTVSRRIFKADSQRRPHDLTVTPAFISLCAPFASSDADVRIIAVLYTHAVMADDRRHRSDFTVRGLLQLCFGPWMIAQRIDHVQTMIDRDLVQLEYRNRDEHDHVIGFTNAALLAEITLTDHALMLIKKREDELLALQDAAKRDTETNADSNVDNDVNSDANDTVSTTEAEQAHEHANEQATDTVNESTTPADEERPSKDIIDWGMMPDKTDRDADDDDDDDDDDDGFANSPQGRAVKELFGQRPMFVPVTLPEAFTYIPDEAIKEQFDQIVAVCSSDVSEILRSYGVSQIASHYTPQRHERTAILLSGAPGTGKTAAAYALAHRLGRELFTTSVDQLNSPYIGMFEKNTRRLFNQFKAVSITKEQAPILLIDECESLFSKRNEATQAADRGHNGAIDILLQEIEMFEGMLILTTNTPDVFDDAFQRRIDHKLHLPGTSKETQRELWRLRLPATMPGVDTIDIEALVRQFDLSAADITLIVRHAVVAAVAQDPVNHRLTQDALTRACTRYKQHATAPSNTRQFGFV